MVSWWLSEPGIARDERVKRGLSEFLYSAIEVFRLKGHGMPTVNHPDQTGDLYATVDVQLPRELTKEQREHFEALARLEKGTKHSAA